MRLRLHILSWGSLPRQLQPGAPGGGLANSRLGAPLERGRLHRTVPSPRSTSSTCPAPAASRCASSRGTCLVSRCPTGCRTRTTRSRTRALPCRRVRSMHMARTRPVRAEHTACTPPARGVHALCTPVRMPCTWRATACVHTPRACACACCMCMLHVHVACACCIYLAVRRGAALRKIPRALRQGHAAGEHQ